MDNENSLEINMSKLDKLIAELETGDLSLEQSFEEYKKGMDLLVKCQNAIDRVEKELEILESDGI